MTANSKNHSSSLIQWAKPAETSTKSYVLTESFDYGFAVDVQDADWNIHLMFTA